MKIEIKKSEESLDESVTDDKRNEKEDKMAAFLKIVDRVQGTLLEITKNNDQIKSLAAEYAKVALDKEEKKISADMSEIISANDKARDVIQKGFEEMDEDIKNTLEDEPKEEKKEGENNNVKEAKVAPPELRMKKQLKCSLIIKFQEILKQTNEAQAEFKKSAQNKLKRRLKIGMLYNCKMFSKP